jgi:cation transport regulator ChaC
MSRRAAWCAWTTAAASRRWSSCPTSAHPQWAGALSLERQAELIAGASGLSGRNVDYLRDLVELRAEGVKEHGPAPWSGCGITRWKSC